MPKYKVNVKDLPVEIAGTVDGEVASVAFDDKGFLEVAENDPALPLIEQAVAAGVVTKVKGKE